MVLRLVLYVRTQEGERDRISLLLLVAQPDYVPLRFRATCPLIQCQEFVLIVAVARHRGGQIPSDESMEFKISHPNKVFGLLIQFNEDAIIFS